MSTQTYTVSNSNAPERVATGLSEIDVVNHIYREDGGDYKLEPSMITLQDSAGNDLPETQETTEDGLLVFEVWFKESSAHVWRESTSVVAIGNNEAEARHTFLLESFQRKRWNKHCWTVEPDHKTGEGSAVHPRTETVQAAQATKRPWWEEAGLALGQYATILFEPIHMSGERICAGVVAKLDTGQTGYRVAIEAPRAREIFGEPGMSIHRIACDLCTALEEHIKQGGEFKDWQPMTQGATIGKIHGGSGNDLAQLLEIALRGHSVLYKLTGINANEPLYLKGSLAGLIPPPSGISSTPLPPT